MTILNNIFFWIAIIMCAIALYKNYVIVKQKEITVSELTVSKQMYNIILAIVILLAVFIRVYKFGSVPGGANQDGAMAAVDAKALADYGTDRYGMWHPVHLTAWGYGQMSALLSYLMVPFIKIGGLNVITMRLPQLLVSGCGLACLYLFCKDAFGKIPALIVFAFAAINPWHILQSRWALDCNLYPHFFMMGIYFLHKGLNKRLYLVISMIMFGLCMYCYGISIYTMPVFLLAVCIYLLVTKKLAIKDALIALAVYLFIAWPFIATMAINFLKLDTIKTPFFTIPYFPNSVRSNDILFFSDNIGKQFVENFKSLMNITLLQKWDGLPWNDIKEFGTIYLFSMPFAIVGLIYLIKDCRKSAGAVFLIAFLCTGIWCGLTTNGVNINRINIVYYPIIILAGKGVYDVIKSISHLKWGIIAIYVVAFIMFASTYFTTYADSMNGYFFKDFGEAVAYLKDYNCDKMYITADSQYQGASNVSEILTLFYQDIDAEYYQGKNNDNSVPFKEKYVFKSIKDITVNPSENAAYVITSSDMGYFDDDNYNFQKFGNYYAVTKK